jgi:hypothetical protein
MKVDLLYVFEDSKHWLLQLVKVKPVLHPVMVKPHSNGKASTWFPRILLTWRPRVARLLNSDSHVHSHCVPSSDPFWRSVIPIRRCFAWFPKGGRKTHTLEFRFMATMTTLPTSWISSEMEPFACRVVEKQRVIVLVVLTNNNSNKDRGFVIVTIRADHRPHIVIYYQQ